MIEDEDDLMECYFKDSDLRESPELRKEVYDAINEDPGMSYEQLALKNGFNLNKKMDL